MDINFKKMNGLVPVITQDATSLKILMQAFVNEEAFDETVKTGRAVYFSRTKNKLWRKGEESGNYQEIVEILIDCDNDSLIFKVNQKGLKASCHNGYESCFYRSFKDGEWMYNNEPKMFNPKDVYKT